jgi:hypothetical protein
MAFCSKCGAQLEGNERFCRGCGHDLSAAGAAASAPGAAAASFAAPAAAQPVAPYPQFYPAAGQIPIVTIPQEVPKHHGWIWGVIIVAGILYGLYYIGSHDQQNQPQGQSPTQQPGTAPPPAGAQPGGPNAALLKQQVLTLQWRVANGDVQLYNQKWDNRSNVAIVAASAECDQLDQNGSVLLKKPIDLEDQTDPALQPGYTKEFDDLDIGPAVQGVSNVNCGIVAVTPAQ